MIQNTLQPHELKRLLQPFLQLADVDSTIQTLSEVLGFPIKKRQDIVSQTKMLLMYKGYRLDITDLRLLTGVGFGVRMQFKTKQKWYHGLFKDQNKEVVQDLKSICESEIHGLSFTRFETTIPGNPFMSDGPVSLVFLHDSRAFNRDWREGCDISPLLLSPDAHDGNCFVEFQFNAGGYMRRGGQTLLREDWASNAFLISAGIEHDAKRMLGVE